jgi:sugar/nucleoside kinase (ribokinase family)
MLDVVCLGNVTIDDIVLHDGTTRMACFGGDAIYAALSARMWSDAVQFVAPIGNDYPAEHIACLQAAGLDLRGMPRREVPTHRNWVIYEQDGRRTWVLRTDERNFFLLSPLTIDVPQVFRQTRSFLILAMDLAAQEDLVAGLRGGDTLIALDPQEDYIPGNEQRVLNMLAGVDIFLPSEIEVQRLVGHQDYHRAAIQFADLGCTIVAIKLGGQGSLLYEACSGRFIRLPAASVQLVDTTGAGDSFSGGFMASYLQTGDVERAGIAGTVSASFAVEDFGLNHLFDVTRAQAKHRLDSFADGRFSWVLGESDIRNKS